jgi:excisionase family DNA binding protein
MYDSVPFETTREAFVDKGAQAVMTVQEAGEKLGLSRGASYDAAARGEIPTIRIGRLLKVPKVAFERMLENAGGTRKPAA